MKINVILQGKLRNEKAIDWIAQYSKRLQADTPLTLIEWGASQRIKEERFFKSLTGADHTVALDERGSHFDTHGLAAHLDALKQNVRNLYLFVGEASGHSPTVLDNVKDRWSLSKLTMSYEVALVMLAEQIYRAVTILQGHPYHK